MGSLLEQALASALSEREAAGLRRRIDDEGRGHVDFCSNDYLGLSRDERVIEAGCAALRDHGAGGRASRLLGGGSPAHAAAERAAAAWLASEAALLFASGYQANLGLVTALVGRGDAIFSDALNHASLIDAARLSRARTFVFAHADLGELERALARASSARRRLVLTESVFSMDGDRAPLAELHAVCARHDADLVVDEAHAAGVLGPGGAGAWAATPGAAENERLVARVVTGGKALGVGGAFVVGSRILREHLLNHARTFVFSTAPPPALAGALERAIAIAREADAARARLRELAAALARELRRPPPDAAIVPWLVGTPEAAVARAAELAARGFDVKAVRPPTVPDGTARLRLACHAYNSAAEVDELARTLRSAGDPAGAAAPHRERTARPLVVTGTDTGVGKTVVSALLLRAARRAGRAAYWKPVQTGTDSDTATVGRLAGALPHELLRPAYELPLPASPHEAAASAGATLEPQRLTGAFDGLRRMLDDTALVVELAGGLLVPYRIGLTQLDWLAREAAPLVLVARSGLGTLNHTLLSLEALRARHLEPRALFLVGAPHASNRETLRAMGGVPAIYEVPLFDALDASALDAWLDAHDLRQLFGA